MGTLFLRSKSHMLPLLRETKGQRQRQTKLPPEAQAPGKHEQQQYQREPRDARDTRATTGNAILSCGTAAGSASGYERGLRVIVDTGGRARGAGTGICMRALQPDVGDIYVCRSQAGMHLILKLFVRNGNVARGAHWVGSGPVTPLTPSTRSNRHQGLPHTTEPASIAPNLRHCLSNQI
jgi:hypothetical protein